MRWGYLRENVKLVEKSSNKCPTDSYTSMMDYLRVIYPKIPVEDWLCNKNFSKDCKYGPDFRNEKLKLVIEVDGVRHYKNPYQIRKDNERDTIFKQYGYKVIRIPFFIQLTTDAVKKLFNRQVENLFDETKASFSYKLKNSPAYMCPAGIERMAKEFLKFPTQYKVNLEALKNYNDSFESGIDYLEAAYLKVLSENE